jgi:hypothetical protein
MEFSPQQCQRIIAYIKSGYEVVIGIEQPQGEFEFDANRDGGDAGAPGEEDSE